MSDNINFDYKNLSPFKWFVLENFPFIEADFDALTEWQLFCKIGKEINKIIDSQNLVGEQAETLTNAFNTLKNYVDNYFNNLDVQDEINNKLNEMVSDGTFNTIVGKYINPILDIQNNAINEQNNKINSLNTKVNSIANISPIPVTSISEMLDTSKVYLNTSNGYWYYYDNEWLEGGVYESSQIYNESIPNLLKNNQYTLYQNTSDFNSNNILQRNVQWFFNKIIPKNKFIQNIGFIAINNANITINIWNLVNNQLLLIKTISKNVTGNNNMQYIDINFTTETECYISLNTDSNTLSYNTLGNNLYIGTDATSLSQGNLRLFKDVYLIGIINIQDLQRIDEIEKQNINDNIINQLVKYKSTDLNNNIIFNPDNIISLTSNARWFYNKKITKNSYIKDLTLISYNNGNTLTENYIEIWKIINDNLVLDKTIPFTLIFKQNELQKVDINYYADNDIMICIKTPTLRNIMYNANGSLKFTDDLTNTSLKINSLREIDNTNIIGSINISNININTTINNNNILKVGINEKYSTIQSAIDNANDSADNPITIIIYPGTYSKFSMRDKLRYISLIGIDKYNTIIQDNTGNYNNPPAEIRTNGIIKNLTFISTHNQPIESTRYSYAIHMDFGNQNVIIENCDCISYQAPAIGIGMYQDDNITIKNCKLISYALNDYGDEYNLGALYCHGNTNENITNQNFTIINNYIESQISNRGGLFIDNITPNNELNVTAIGNMIYDNTNKKIVTLNHITLKPESFGNNITSLNI